MPELVCGFGVAWVYAYSRGLCSVFIAVHDPTRVGSASVCRYVAVGKVAHSCSLPNVFSCESGYDRVIGFAGRRLLRYFQRALGIWQSLVQCLPRPWHTGN